MSIIEGQPPLAAAPVPEEARLRRASHDLEGIFVEQLFKAMRETVPQDSLFGGGSGEEMFTSMMDSHLASQVPGTWENGLAESLYRQLRGAMGAAEGEAAPAAPTLPADPLRPGDTR